MGEAVTRDCVTINGSRIAVRMDGPANAPVVMFANSLAADLTMWDPQVASLSARWRCLRYDMRGHGASDPAAGECGIADLAGDAISLLDELGISRVHFVGLSLGGMVGQHIGAMQSDRLRSLTLCATVSAQAGDVWTARIAEVRSRGMAALVEPTLARWLTESFRTRNPEIADRVGRMIAGTSVEGYVCCAAAIRDMDLTPLLGRIAAATMVIAGEADPAMPPSAVQPLHERIAGSEFVVIEDAAHLLNVEQPQAFNAVVGSFLARHEGAPPGGVVGAEAAAC